MTAVRGAKVSEDVVFPPEHLAEGLAGLERIGERRGLRSCAWGHGGEGNVHATVLVDPANEREVEAGEAAAEDMFALVLSLGGSITGEHGVGWLKRGRLAEQWDARAIELHEQARARGVDTGFDVIPYIAANTTLLAIYPPWALAGGVDALLQRLRDPQTRKKVARSIEEDVPGWPCWTPGGWPHNLVEATGWKNVWVMWVESDRNKSLEGKSLQAIADERGKDPFEVAADLTLEESGHAMCLYFGVSGELNEETGLETLMAHPYAAFETDAIITGKGVPHPAGYGAMPRVLGHFVRNRKLFPLEDGVRRITSLPAQRFGLKKRGVIRAGAFADLVVFDPSTIDDRTTYTEPTREPAGIDYVMINGQVVVDHGRFDSAKLAGQVIRKGAANA